MDGRASIRRLAAGKPSIDLHKDAHAEQFLCDFKYFKYLYICLNIVKIAT